VNHAICACGKPAHGRHTRCAKCIYRSRPRIPCAKCSGPTSRFTGDKNAPSDPVCARCISGNRPKICTVDGCDSKHQALGLCATHYSQLQRERNGGKRYDRKVEIACEYCGGPRMVNAQHADVQRYCSLSCSSRANQSGLTHDEFMQRQRRRNRDRHRRNKERARMRELKRVTQPPAAWKSVQCCVCTQWFISKQFDMTCSDECNIARLLEVRRKQRGRRRARERNAYVADVQPSRVFELDGYRCHLCNKKCDATKVVPHPRAPTVDHVIPLSNGGTHEPANCRTACFICNSTKGSRGGGEQLALIG